MKVWESIRLRCLRDGEKIKVVASDLQLAPNTVRKYLRSDEPPRRRLRPRAHLLDPYQSHIDEMTAGPLMAPETGSRMTTWTTRRTKTINLTIRRQAPSQLSASRARIIVPAGRRRRRSRTTEALQFFRDRERMIARRNDALQTLSIIKYVRTRRRVTQGPPFPSGCRQRTSGPGIPRHDRLQAAGVKADSL